MTATKGGLDEGRMTLMEHLTELRTRIIRSLIAIVVGAVIGWFLYDWILDILIKPYCDLDPGGDGSCKLVALTPTEGFSTHMMVAGYTGVGLAIPVWLWQAWRFVSPGLYPRERRHGITFVVLGVALFALGVALAYWSLPRALAFLSDVGGQDLVSTYRAKDYIEFIVKMMLAFGLGFEFPLVLVFLQILGVVHWRALGRQRRMALIGIVVLVAVITPSGDPFTLMVLTTPMYLFYEASIIFGWLRDRRIAGADS